MSNAACVSAEGNKPAFISSFQFETADVWNKLNPTAMIQDGDVLVVQDNVEFLCGTARRRRNLLATPGEIIVPSIMNLPPSMDLVAATAASAEFKTAATAAYSSSTSKFAQDFGITGSVVTQEVPAVTTAPTPTPTPTPATNGTGTTENLLVSLVSFEFMGVDFDKFMANAAKAEEFEEAVVTYLSVSTGGLAKVLELRSGSVIVDTSVTYPPGTTQAQVDANLKSMLDTPGNIFPQAFLNEYGFSSVESFVTADGSDNGNDSKALALGLGLGLGLGIPLLLLIGVLLYRRRSGQVIHPKEGTANSA